MSILIVNTLDKNDLSVEKVISDFKECTHEIKVINTEELNINPCIGCNACWLRTPGVCALKDDYKEILVSYLQYDKTIFICKTSLEFVDYRMKNLTDRSLPLATMYTRFVDGQMRHVPRYEKNFEFGLIYFGEADNDYLNKWLSRFSINMHGKSIGAYQGDKYHEVLKCI